MRRLTDGGANELDRIRLPLLLLRGREGELRVDVCPQECLEVGLEKCPSRLWLDTAPTSVENFSRQ